MKTSADLDDKAFIVVDHRPPDYRTFVDPDIAAMFENKGSYLSFEPLLAQLIKELRRHNAAKDGSDG